MIPENYELTVVFSALCLPAAAIIAGLVYYYKRKKGK